MEGHSYAFSSTSISQLLAPTNISQLQCMYHNIIPKAPATGVMQIFKNQSCSLRTESEFVVLITKKACKINCERTNEKHAKSVIFHSFSWCSSEAWLMVSECLGRIGEDQEKEKAMIPQKGGHLLPIRCHVFKQMPSQYLLCIPSDSTTFTQLPHFVPANVSLKTAFVSKTAKDLTTLHCRLCWK